MRGSLPVRIVNSIAVLLFAVFAWVQVNDLDPEIYDRPSIIDAAFWCAFYALVGSLFVVLLFRPVPRWLLALALVACAVQLVRTAPGMWENLTGEAPFTLTDRSMTASDPRVELSREFLGTVIALLAIAVAWWQSRRPGARTPEETARLISS